MNLDDVLADYLDTGDEALLAGLTPDDADAARSLRAALDDEATWGGPADDLLGRIQAEVAVTAQEPSPLRAPAPVPPPPVEVAPPVAGAGTGAVVDLSAARSRRRGLHPAVGALLGAAAAAAVAIGVAVVPRGGDGGAGFALAATDLAPGAAGSGRARSTASGIEITLEIDGLPRAPAGSFYEAWLKGDKGLVPIGTFHTGGRIVLWSGVEPRDYPQLTVTIEPEDGDPASSGRRILTADVPID